MAGPTSYADVNEIMELLMANVRKILGEHFVGMYLYGSLATGDFHPETSDIDFLVVTTDTLPPEKVTRLGWMHRRIWDLGMKWAGKLEGSYVHRELIRRHDPNGAACPTVNEGQFFVDRRGSDWIIQRHVIREYGVTLAGPDPKSLIDLVSPDEIRCAVQSVLQEWWFPMLEDPAWLAKRGSEYHAYAILTICRALHARQHGTIVSKRAAARWAQTRLEAKWSPVIEQALAAQKPGSTQAGLLGAALDLIRYTKEASEI